MSPILPRALRRLFPDSVCNLHEKLLDLSEGAEEMDISIQELCAELRVSRWTIQRALRVLSRAGVLEWIPGRRGHRGRIVFCTTIAPLLPHNCPTIENPGENQVVIASKTGTYADSGGRIIVLSSREKEKASPLMVSSPIPLSSLSPLEREREIVRLAADTRADGLTDGDGSLPEPATLGDTTTEPVRPAQDCKRLQSAGEETHTKPLQTINRADLYNPTLPDGFSLLSKKSKARERKISKAKTQVRHGEASPVLWQHLVDMVFKTFGVSLPNSVIGKDAAHIKHVLEYCGGLPAAMEVVSVAVLDWEAVRQTFSVCEGHRVPDAYILDTLKRELHAAAQTKDGFTTPSCRVSKYRQSKTGKADYYKTDEGVEF